MIVSGRKLHTLSFLDAAELIAEERPESRFSITPVAFEVEATMPGKEKVVLLREYVQQRWSKSSFAEELGISRRTKKSE